MPKNELNKHNIPVKVNLKGVGKNLIDHIEIAVINRLSEPYVYSGCEFIDENGEVDSTNKNDPCFLFYKVSGKGPYANNLVSVAYDLKVPSGSSDPLRVDSHVLSFATFFENFDLIDTLQPPLFNPNFTYHTSLLEVSHPRSRGTIKLQSNSPYEIPLINEQLWENDNDIRIAVETVEIIRKVMKQVNKNNGDTKLVLEEVLPGKQLKGKKLANYIREESAFGHHICGTCKMGTKCDKNAVVDSKLKVFGVKNLRIIDASVMPTIPSANPTIPIYIVAEIGVSAIKEKYCF